MSCARRAGLIGWALALGLASCAGGGESAPPRADDIDLGPVAWPAVVLAPAAAVSVAAVDRSTVRVLASLDAMPVEAVLLLVSADGAEPELAAMRSVLDHRGVPYDVFIASAEPPLTAARLSADDHGFYQGTILMSSALTVGGGSALSAAEWGALADYEAEFRIRRAVLAAWPDPALGFGAAHAVAASITVDCTPAGAAVFRDVRCGMPQRLEGGGYLATVPSGGPLTPLLTDAAGHALAVVHDGADGRASLLLLFRNAPTWLHAQLLLHDVLGWVTGGTYLGERHVWLGAQVDDVFIASALFGGGTYRLHAADLVADRAWLATRRAAAVTPDFRVALAFNGFGAVAGEPFTDEAVAQSADWHWINHTYAHAELDSTSYATAFEQLELNQLTAAALPLVGFDERSLVTPSVSGLVNPAAMQAALDLGVRFAVTDTSRAGCSNPSPNTAFYDEVAPALLLVPRRPTNLFYNVSTPAQWVSEYDAFYSGYWGGDSTYAEVLDHESDVLVLYLLRGELDPWMFHQANLRAYDGVHSLLGDLLDATVAKLAARSRAPILTPPMSVIGERFAARMVTDGAGVRATLFPGRALVLDVASAAVVPVTGVRAADGAAYGGDVIGQIAVVPGTSTCVPLDVAGEGCSPPPVRAGGPGLAHGLVLGRCNASSLPPPIDAGVVDAPVVDAAIPTDAAVVHVDAQVVDAASPTDAQVALIDARAIDAAIPIDAPVALLDARAIDAAIPVDAPVPLIDARVVDAAIPIDAPIVLVDARVVDAAIPIDAAAILVDAAVDAGVDAATDAAVDAAADARLDAGVDARLDAGADAAGADAGAMPVDAGRLPPDARTTRPTDTGGGCSGCSTSAPATPASTALVLLAGLLAARRRVRAPAGPRAARR